MRILIINTLYPPSQVGGAEKSVMLLAESLVACGDKVCVVSLHPKGSELIEIKSGVKIYRLPLDNFYWPFHFGKKESSFRRLLWHGRDIWNSKAASRLALILEEEKPDVVHTNNLTGFSVSVWEVVRQRNIRIVHTLRDYSLACVRSSMFRSGRVCKSRCTECRLLTSIKKKQSSRVDAVVSNSQFVISAHQRAGYFAQVPNAVIYNIADVNTQERTASGRDTPQTALIFGFIGRVEKEKGIEIVLQATQQLTSSDWRLRVAGRGLENYIEGLKSRFPDPRIEWVGFVNSKDFFASIDVSLISSVWPEPLPRTLIEAYSSGCSAICSDAGGIPEISNLGTTTAVYPSTDSAALSRLMNNALENPTQWRKGGFVDASALGKFSIDEVTSRYRAIYSGRI